jgi:hypothetical protein
MELLVDQDLGVRLRREKAVGEPVFSSNVREVIANFDVPEIYGVSFTRKWPIE